MSSIRTSCSTEGAARLGPSLEESPGLQGLGSVVLQGCSPSGVPSSPCCELSFLWLKQ